MRSIVEAIVRVGRQLAELLVPSARPAPVLVPVRVREPRRRR